MVFFSQQHVSPFGGALCHGSFESTWFLPLGMGKELVGPGQVWPGNLEPVI